MGDENHANATPRKTRHQAPELGPEGAIDLRGHLIEHEIARLHCEHRSQREALELSARKRLHLTVLEARKPHSIKRIRNSLRYLPFRATDIPQTKSEFVAYDGRHGLVRRILANIAN